MYNEKFAWFDKLSDGERRLFFNFLIVRLKITPEELRMLYDDSRATFGIKDRDDVASK